MAAQEGKQQVPPRLERVGDDEEEGPDRGPTEQTDALVAFNMRDDDGTGAAAAVPAAPAPAPASPFQLPALLLPPLQQQQQQAAQGPAQVAYGYPSFGAYPQPQYVGSFLSPNGTWVNLHQMPPMVVACAAPVISAEEVATMQVLPPDMLQAAVAGSQPEGAAAGAGAEATGVPQAAAEAPAAAVPAPSEGEVAAAPAEAAKATCDACIQAFESKEDVGCPSAEASSGGQSSGAGETAALMRDLAAELEKQQAEDAAAAAKDGVQNASPNLAGVQGAGCGKRSRSAEEGAEGPEAKRHYPEAAADTS